MAQIVTANTNDDYVRTSANHLLMRNLCCTHNEHFILNGSAGSGGTGGEQRKYLQNFNTQPDWFRKRSMSLKEPPPIIIPLRTSKRSEMDLKRCSLYSQMSLESIDSHLDVLDSSTMDAELESPKIPLSIQQPSLIPMSPTSQTKNLSKAKSDSHLFFCLEDGLFKELYGHDLPLETEDAKPDTVVEEVETPPASIKRNTQQRQSFYAKFISKRHSAKVPQGKSRFKFRYSSKVSKNKDSGESESDDLCKHKQSIHRASEPFINYTSEPRLRYPSKLRSQPNLAPPPSPSTPTDVGPGARVDRLHDSSLLTRPLSLTTNSSGWKLSHSLFFVFSSSLGISIE